MKKGAHQETDGITYYAKPDEPLLQAGAELVNEVSLLTGFPDPSRWPDGALITHTRKRQEMAYQVVVATTNVVNADQRVVAHSLLLPPRRESWGEVDAAVPFLNAGVLAELGATAVHPDYQRRGIATAMQQIRIAEAHSKGLVLCVSVWDGGNSHAMYDGKDGWTYLGSSMAFYTKRLIHRYIESTALEH